MRVIQRMKNWWRLRCLEQRVKRRRSPSSLSDLGKAYIANGSYDRAARVAEDGLMLFPISSRLSRLLNAARRLQWRRRVEAQRAGLTWSSSPALFRQVAAATFELNDLDALQRLCRQWSCWLPGDPHCWHLLGRAHLANFYRDLTASEGVEAVTCLTRAVELAPNEQQPRRLLGEVLYRIGAVAEARPHLAALCALAPQDEELSRLLSYVTTLSDLGGDLRSQLEAVEAVGALQHGPLKGDASAAASADRRCA